MKVGIPKGLMYYKYHPFYESFFKGLGADVITSPDTNKNILNSGIKTCVDEACLPVKIFHGHVSFLKDKCDIIFIPRIMQLKKREYICPKFCGLPEMITSSIPDLPKIISTPIYATSYNKIYKWAVEASKDITIDKSHIKHALNKSLMEQKRYDEKLKSKINSPNNNNNIKKKNIKIAIIGEIYTVIEPFTNMHIEEKLMDYGVSTKRRLTLSWWVKNMLLSRLKLNSRDINRSARGYLGLQIGGYAKECIGEAVLSHEEGLDGAIQVFPVGCMPEIVSKSILPKISKDKNYPIMSLVVDEMTGEAGLVTRIEAFIDLLERKRDNVLSGS